MLSFEVVSPQGRRPVYRCTLSEDVLRLLAKGQGEVIMNSISHLLLVTHVIAHPMASSHPLWNGFGHATGTFITS